MMSRGRQAAAIALLVVNIVSTGRASERPRWFAFHVVAGSHRLTNVTIHVAFHLERASDGPGLMGIATGGGKRFADGGSEYGGDQGVMPLAAGESALALSSGGLSLRRSIGPAPHATFDLTTEVGVEDLDPGEELFVVEFFTSYTAEITQGHARSDSGALPVTIWTGTRTEVLAAGDRSDMGGASAQVASAGAGLVQESNLVTDGIVGAFNGWSCEGACVYTSESPDGAQVLVRSVGAHSSVGAAGLDNTGGNGFAGPAGTWRWTWAATASTNVAFGAYAIIGDLWRDLL